MDTSEFMKNFIESIITNLVDFENDVVVITSITTTNILIQIKTNRKDIGKIIGKNGKTIESLKTISLAVKNTKFPDDRRKIAIEVLEEPIGYKNKKENINGDLN